MFNSIMKKLYRICSCMSLEIGTIIIIKISKGLIEIEKGQAGLP